MIPPERLGRFFLAAVLIYAGLMAPWPGARRAYARLFRAGGNMVFSRFWFWPHGTVRFLDLHSPDLASEIQSAVVGRLPPAFEPPTPTNVKDTLMVLSNRRAPKSFGQLRTSSRYAGYGPTVVLIALVLSTPLPWSRRVRALLWGFLLVLVFVVGRLTLTLAAGGFAAAKSYALFDPSPFWRGVLTRAEGIFSDNPTVSFVIPALIWFLVALRGTGGRRILIE